MPGFVNRDEKKPIKLRLPGKSSKGQLVVAATFEAAVHETIHLNSNTQFQTDFGHNYSEGVYHMSRRRLKPCIQDRHFALGLVFLRFRF